MNTRFGKKNQLKFSNSLLGDDESDDDCDSEGEIYSEGNNVFFYAPVNKKNVLSLNKLLKSLQVKLLKDSIEYDMKPNINLYVHSEGGCVFSGLSAMNHIRNCKVDVHTIIDGAVASAGTFLTIAGKKRYILPHSIVLIHQLRTGFYGKHEDLKDEVENCTHIMDSFKKIYKDNSSLPDRTLNQLLKRELYLTAEDCIKYKLVDGYES